MWSYQRCLTDMSVSCRSRSRAARREPRPTSLTTAVSVGFLRIADLPARTRPGRGGSSTDLLDGLADTELLHAAEASRQMR